MKLFLDANILVSVLNKEYPFFAFTARILSLQPQKYELFTSPVCLAIAFYFAEKKHGTAKAKEKISLLSRHIAVSGNSPAGVLKTLENKAIHDFEDGLEYYAAVESHCNCLITEDINDFYFSEIEVLSSRDFCNKYLLKHIDSGNC